MTFLRPFFVFRHTLVFDTPAEASSTMRNLYWRGYHPLAAAVRPATAADGFVGPAAPSVGPAAAARVSAPMATPLPPNVLLQTLQVLASDWDSIPAPYDVPSPHPGGNHPVPAADPTALPDGTVLLRLHHIYAAGEGAVGDAAPAVVDLAGLFAAKAIGSATELTLSAIMPLANLTRLKWNTGKDQGEGEGADGGAGAGAGGLAGCVIDRSAPGKMAVTVNPMDICTYAIQFK